MKKFQIANQLTGDILFVGSPNAEPDMEYGSGFRAPDPVVFLETKEKRYLVVSRLEIGRARRVAAASRERKKLSVLTPEDILADASQRRRIEFCALGLLRTLGVRHVTVSRQFPVGVAQFLKARRIRIGVASEAMYPARAVKRPQEIERIRESQQAAVIATRKAVDIIQESSVTAEGSLVYQNILLTSERLRHFIQVTLLEHKCFCRDAIVACGKQGADPHEIGSGPLYAGQPIVLDIFPQHLEHGYWGDLTRTVVKGCASPSLKRMYQAVKAAQSEALNTIAPRVGCSTVHKAASREIRQRGFKTEVKNGIPRGFIHGTGHGLGLEIHEAPSLSMNPKRLRCGNVITIEPGLYNPDVGGIRIEDTVLVTESGWRYLVPCEKKFEI